MQNRQDNKGTPKRLLWVAASLLLVVSLTASPGMGLRATGQAGAVSPACATVLAEAAEGWSGSGPTVGSVAEDLTSISAACRESRAQAQANRPAYTYYKPDDPSASSTAFKIDLIGLCGEGSAYQVNFYDYATGEFTLLQAPSAASQVAFPELAALTEQMNQEFDARATAILEARKALDPEAYQDLEVTFAVTDGTMKLVYAFPAPTFDFSGAATDQLQAEVGDAMRLLDGAGGYTLLHMPSDAEVAAFPELAALARTMNEEFGARASALVEARVAANPAYEGLELALEFTDDGLELVYVL